MKKYTSAIRHSTNNGLTLYTQNGNKVYLRRRALDIFLKKYALCIEYTDQLITQGQIYFTITEKL